MARRGRAGAAQASAGRRTLLCCRRGEVRRWAIDALKGWGNDSARQCFCSDGRRRNRLRDQLCWSPQCGLASTERGNLLTEDLQWARLGRIGEIVAWG